MTPNRMLTAWLRPFAGVLAVVAALALSACGGGSGAPNNPYAPASPVAGPLVILPAAPTIYAQVATTLTISGGVAPYRAFSSNSAILPVTANLPGNTLTLLAATVNAATTVTVTVQDAANTTVSVDATVLPGSPLVALPNPVDVYSTVATMLSVNGGMPPYRAFSSNSTVLPVASSVSNNALTLLASAVAADTTVTVTIQDAVNQQVAVPVTVHPKAVITTPVVVLPSSVVIYRSAPVTIAISGGLPPYKAYSSNPTVIPVTQTVAGSSLVLTAGAVAADTNVTITIQDSAGQTATVSALVKADAVVALAVLPATTIVYSGVPSALTVTGGTPPYSAFSSNATVLPVTQAVAGGAIPLLAAPVTTDTAVSITVQDSGNATVSSLVIVRPAALLNTLVIKPNSTDCGTNAICSGQSGTATVTLQLPGGGPASGRQVRFDAIFGPYGIVPSTGAATVASLVVSSDANGNAQVVIRANVDAPTQPSQIKVTDIASGQQITGDFLIQQRTDGTTLLTVVPAETNITGAYKGECSFGFVVDYFIYGGTPPYRITQGFPDGAVIVNPIVNASGGYFEVVTNGTCVNPDIFSIVDATGRQTTAKLNNLEGSVERPAPTPPPELAIVPGDLSAKCTDAIFTYIVTGGTPPYNASASPRYGASPSLSNSGIVTSNGGLLTVSSVTQNVTLSFVDSSSPKKTLNRTITCSEGGGTTTGMQVSPTFYAPTAACTVGMNFDFTVSGGTAPYAMAFAATPPSPASITKLDATHFRVSGLSQVNTTNYLSLTDSSSTQQQLVPYITCP